MTDHSETTVIVGVGNPICGDDAIGIHVARELRSMYAATPRASSLAFHEAPYSGWRLVELISGFNKAIIIDAVTAPDKPIGSCISVDPNAHTSCTLRGSHEMTIFDAIALHRAAQHSAPQHVALYGVVIEPPAEFSEALSPAVKSATRSCAETIAQKEHL